MNAFYKSTALCFWSAIAAFLLTSQAASASPTVFYGKTANPAGYEISLRQMFSQYELYSIPVADIHQYLTAPQYTGGFDLQLGKARLWQIKLHQHDLRAGNYQAWEIGENGQKTPLPPTPCITYKGWLNQSGGGEVRMSVEQSSMYGFATQDGKEFFIQPLGDFLPYSASQNLFVVYQAQHVLGSGGTCASQQLQLAAKQLPDGGKGNSYAKSGAACQDIEYASAADYSMFTKKGGTTATNNYIQTIINLVEPLYAPFEIEFAIVEQYVVSCSGCDPWTGSTDPEDLLGFDQNGNPPAGSFSNWAGNGGFAATHDLGGLFTNRNFDGGNIGLAWVGVVGFSSGLCGGYTKYGVYQDYSNSTSHVRSLVAHEIGHNCSAEHDASGAPYIMAPSVDAANPATTWSSTSSSVISSKVASVGCLSPCISCPAVANVSVNATSASSIQAVWNDNGMAQYNVKIREAGSASWLVQTTVNTESYTYGGLSGCTDYEISVSSECGGVIGVETIESFVTAQLSISSVSVTGCNPGSATYDLEVNLNYSNLTGSGNINVGGTNTPFTFGGSPQTIALSGLPANGSSGVSVSVTSTNVGSCTASSSFDAPPASCGCITVQSADFNDCALPAGWTNTALGTNAAGVWQFDSNPTGANTSGGNIDGTCMAYFDDDEFDTDGGETMELLPPPVNVANASSVELSFDYNYWDDSGGYMAVDVWNGVVWINLLTVTSDNCGLWGSCAYPNFSADVVAFANAAFQVRFTYSDGGGWQWAGAIDNYELCAEYASPAAPTVQLRVFLEGAYNGAGMNTNLRSDGLLPLLQPYSTAPWNFNTGQSVASLLQIPSNAVDWVILELRSGANNALVVDRRAAFLLNTGWVMDIDGLTNGVNFPNAIVGGDYYIAVRHRNHLDAISKDSHTLGAASVFDFTANGQTGGTGNTVNLGGGNYALMAGDFNGDGSIDDGDRQYFKGQMANMNGFWRQDADLDGRCVVDDFNLMLKNMGNNTLPVLQY